MDIGGNRADAGIVMGSIGITTLGAIPFLTPLMDRYGRKPFIVGGILVGGLSNAGFMLFDHYSHLMTLVRLVQGIGFAACFNACATAIVDLVPPEYRAQGIGLFGVSSSFAFMLGPFMAESILIAYGFDSYFLLLVGFGLIGLVAGVMVKEPNHVNGVDGLRDFFPTAFRGGYLDMMAIALAFGSGFAAMNVFFPLYAQTLGLRAGPFFTAFGVALFVVRVLLGEIADKIERERLVFVCLIGFAVMLLLTSFMHFLWHTIALGAMFGALQGIAYPAMMTRMVDRARDNNRAIVVGLFTGSFGLGINASVLFWGFVAQYKGFAFMYIVGGIILLAAAFFPVLPRRSAK